MIAHTAQWHRSKAAATSRVAVHGLQRVDQAGTQLEDQRGVHRIEHAITVDVANVWAWQRTEEPRSELKQQDGVGGVYDVIAACIADGASGIRRRG